MRRSEVCNGHQNAMLQCTSDMAGLQGAIALLFLSAIWNSVVCSAFSIRRMIRGAYGQLQSLEASA